VVIGPMPECAERYEDGQSERQIADDGKNWQEQSNNDHHYVDGQCACEPLGERLHVLAGQVGPHELRVDRVTPHNRDKNQGPQQVNPVDSRGDALGIGFPGVLGKQPRGNGRNETSRSSSRFTVEDVQGGVLIAVAPIVGTPRVVSAAGNIAKTLDFVIDVAMAEAEAEAEGDAELAGEEA
jgi:hypothetical protein